MMTAPVDRPLESGLTLNPRHVPWNDIITSLRLVLLFIRGDDGGDLPGHILGK
jgi:hypothetical protein